MPLFLSPQSRGEKDVENSPEKGEADDAGKRGDHCWGAVQEWLGKIPGDGTCAQEKGPALASSRRLVCGRREESGESMWHSSRRCLQSGRGFSPYSLAVHTETGNEVARWKFGGGER